MTKRFVYVLCNTEPRPRYYVGITADVAARLDDHNEGRCPHTAKHRPWCRRVVIDCEQSGDEASTLLVARRQLRLGGAGRLPKQPSSHVLEARTTLSVGRRVAVERREERNRVGVGVWFMLHHGACLSRRTMIRWTTPAHSV